MVIKNIYHSILFIVILQKIPGHILPLFIIIQNYIFFIESCSLNWQRVIAGRIQPGIFKFLTLSLCKENDTGKGITFFSISMQRVLLQQELNRVKNFFIFCLPVFVFHHNSLCFASPIVSNSSLNNSISGRRRCVDFTFPSLCCLSRAWKFLE